MPRNFKPILSLAIALLLGSALVPIAAEAAPKKKSAAACQTTSLNGSVAAWSYSSKGDMHGFYLDSGVEVKFAPHEGASVDAILDVGSSASVSGCLTTSPSGNTHLKATTITNADTGASYSVGGTAPPPKGTGSPPPPSDGSPPPPPPSDGSPPPPPAKKPPRR